MSDNKRPLSPHLQIYKWQITSVMSILHRFAEIALSFGLLMFAWWIISMALGVEAFYTFQKFCSSWIGQLMLIGWSFAIFFHMFSNVRYLLWDLGYGFELRTVSITGWLVVVGSAVAAAVAIFIAYVNLGLSVIH